MTNPYTLSVGKYSTHSMLKSIIGSGHTVLDVGCNSGYIGQMMIKGNKFYGIDHLEEAVVEAKKNYIDAKQIDLNKPISLPWTVAFDTIIFLDVLEHVLDPDQVLNYFVKNHLQNGGRVVVSLPNVANWYIRLKLLFGKFDYTETGILDKTHLHLYTFKSAKKLVTNAKLQNLQVKGGASFFGPIIILLPFLRNTSDKYNNSG